MKKKLLITGISGFLGWNIAQFPQEDWQVIGTHYSNPLGVPNSTSSYQIDLTQKADIQKLINEVKPDAILHLAANSSTGLCEKNPASSYPINVTATQYLAEICQENKLPFLYTSTEQVFDGLKNSYTEIDVPNPINEYGKQKLLGEKIVTSTCPTACIARLSVMFGFHGKGAFCFMNNWLNKWKNQQAVTVFKDEYRSFLSGTSAAAGLFLLLNKKASGIYHLGGKKAFSRYDFAIQMRTVFGLKHGKIIPAWQKDFTGIAARPPRLVLNMDKMQRLGFCQKSTLEELNQLAKYQ